MKITAWQKRMLGGGWRPPPRHHYKKQFEIDRWEAGMVQPPIPVKRNQVQIMVLDAERDEDRLIFWCIIDVEFGFGLTIQRGVYGTAHFVEMAQLGNDIRNPEDLPKLWERVTGKPYERKGN